MSGAFFSGRSNKSYHKLYLFLSFVFYFALLHFVTISEGVGLLQSDCGQLTGSAVKGHLVVFNWLTWGVLFWGFSCLTLIYCVYFVTGPFKILKDTFGLCPPLFTKHSYMLTSASDPVLDHYCHLQAGVCTETKYVNFNLIFYYLIWTN